jgi:hypothetical protein
MTDPGSNPYRIAVSYLRQAVKQANNPTRHAELLRAMELLMKKAVEVEREERESGV